VNIEVGDVAVTNAGNVAIGVGGNVMQSKVNSGGGAYFGGNVTAGGEIVGRDKIVHGDEVRGDKIAAGDITNATGVAIGRGAHATVNQGIQPRDLDALFVELVAATRSVPPEKRDAVDQQVGALKAEVAKGDKADDGKMATIVKGLVEMVPGAVGAVVSMFASPILGGIALPVTKWVLSQFGQR
jgi:hypothetical protein